MPVCVECHDEELVCTGRCNKCNAFKSKMRRLCDTHVLESFAALDKAKRVDWFQTKHELMGPDLKSELSNLVEEEKTNKTELKLVGTGDWLDEVELEEKYKHNPARAAAIIANTKTHWCDIGKVKLFQDTRYTTQSADNETATTRQKRTIEQQDTMKKAKKTKKEPAVDGGGDPAVKKEEGDANRKFTEPQKKQLNMMKSKLEAILNKLEEAKATATQEDYLKYIGQHIVGVWARSTPKATEPIANIELLIDSATGVFKDGKERVDAFKLEMKTFEQRLSNAAEEAIAHKADVGQHSEQVGS